MLRSAWPRMSLLMKRYICKDKARKNAHDKHTLALTVHSRGTLALRSTVVKSHCWYALTATASDNMHESPWATAKG